MSPSVGEDHHHPNESTSNLLLPRRIVEYCGACGMPYEYCEYGPDYETHCIPYLRKHHPELAPRGIVRRKSSTKQQQQQQQQQGDTTTTTTNSNNEKVPKPEKPWTTEQRLLAFYEKYEPTKIDSVPSLLEKYSGKEDKLFIALTKKYGPEPTDPYYSDSDDDEDDDDDDHNESGDEGEDEEVEQEEEDGDEGEGKKKKKSKRRGVSAKKVGGEGSIVPVRVVITKKTQKKKRCLTVVTGMETVPGHIKLKDVCKVLSKKFAGSSSVKDDKDIIVQGDHIIDLAEMLIDKFHIPEHAIYLDMDNDGKLIPFR